jgi:hypothetical protein
MNNEIVRLSSEDVKRVLAAFSEWTRYRSPYGTVLSIEAKDEFELVVDGGVLIGERGDFVCIDDVTYECWVSEPCEFHRLYTIIPIDTPD